jgi:GH25 family lysozyme M1 (1,4-beta-N-acetylmuramidase)
VQVINVMIYSYAKFLTDYVSPSVLNSYDIWVASWGDENKLKTYYTGNFCMWQYSSTGKVNGINGNVDLDYSYVDYGY